MTRSFKRYEVLTYLSTYSLEMFMFERFPKCAPQPNKLPTFHEKKFVVNEAGNLVLDKDMKEQPLPCKYLRTDMWRRCGRARQLGLVLDREEEFVFRPYVAAVVGISRGVSYPGEDVVMNSEDGELMLAGAWALPKVLPRDDEGFEKLFSFSVGYSPQQVAKQLGYDQVAARIVSDI